MEKKVILLITSILVISCHNNSELKETECLPRSSPRILPCIEEAFSYYIKHEVNPDTDTYYSMSFIKGEPEFTGSDTMISFCRHNKFMSQEGFIGQTSIYNYKILVFDKKNIGDSFFNRDSLSKVDIDTLTVSSEISYCDVFVIMNNSLQLIGCQPDDFVPIKIDRDQRQICGRKDGKIN